MPGHIGLNAGILPSPGFTYVNMDLNYNAGALNDRSGNAVPITGNYNVWVVENIFYFVPNTKSLGTVLLNPNGCGSGHTITIEAVDSDGNVSVDAVRIARPTC